MLDTKRAARAKRSPQPPALGAFPRVQCKVPVVSRHALLGADELEDSLAKKDIAANPTYFFRYNLVLQRKVKSKKQVNLR